MGRPRLTALYGLACLLCALLCAHFAECGKDYYASLGISRGADDATIKRAYKKLALCVTRSSISAYYYDCLVATP